jgi:uncharacterized membrane protein YhfC
MRRVMALSIAVLFLLTSSTESKSRVSMKYRWASVQGGQLEQSEAGEEFYFDIPVDEAMIEEGVPITIDVNGEVLSGSLRYELRDPRGQVVWNSGTIGPGDFSINSKYHLASAHPGTYTLGIVYSDNVSATYNLGWHAIRLGPSILLSGIGMISVSLAFVVYAAYRRWLGWWYLVIGALFWVITVSVKFAFAIPLNPILFQALGVTHDRLFSRGNLIAYFYIGALTGIFEAGLAYLILRRIRWGMATCEQALAFGIGFGVIEAFLLGLVGLASAFPALFSPDVLPIPTLGNLANQAAVIMGLAPVVERVFVILAHMFSCLLIFYAINSSQAKWAWLAILYKTLLDVPAGFASFWEVETPAKLWTIEAMIAVAGVIGLLGLIWVVRHYPVYQASRD